MIVRAFLTALCLLLPPTLRAWAEPATVGPPAAPALTAEELGYDIAETGLDGRTFVVSADGDDANAGTVEQPMRTPQAAADRVEPGDTVLLRAGVYANSGPDPVIEVRKGGTRRNWVRFASYPGETATIRFDGLRGIRVADVAYVLIENMEVVGVAGEIDLAEALAHATAFDGRDSSRHRFFGVGIRLGGLPGEEPHHVIVRGNEVHHTPGGGITTARSDYVLVEGNHIYKTGFYSPWGESGISLRRSVDSDGDRRNHKMVVKDNVVHQNDNLVPFWIMDDFTDGNAILLDAHRARPDAPPGAESDGYRSYKGRFLIVNNVCSGNGGRGVRVLDTHNVDVLHNTLARNATRGNTNHEVELGRTDRVRVRNNVIVPIAGKEAFGGYQTERTDVDFNLVEGEAGGAFRVGGHGARGQAAFVQAPSKAVRPGGPVPELPKDGFRLGPESAGLGAGDGEASFPVDRHGDRRDPERPDVGAG